MPGEAVGGMNAVLLPHATVPGHLGDNGCGGYGTAESVALYHGAERDADLWQRNGVDEDVVRPDFEPGDGASHGRLGGGNNAEGVDIFRFNEGDVDGAGVCLNQLGQLLPLAGRNDFAIVQVFIPFMVGTGIQDDGSCDDGSGQWASPHLVDSGNERVAFPEEEVLF